MKEYFQPKEFGLSLKNGISHKRCWFNEESMYLPSTQLWSVWSDILHLLAQCHGALGILWDSQVFLITPLCTLNKTADSRCY